MELIGKQNQIELLSRLHRLILENAQLKEKLKDVNLHLEEFRLLEQIAYMVCSAASCEDKKGFDETQVELLRFACEEWRVFKISHPERHNLNTPNH